MLRALFLSLALLASAPVSAQEAGGDVEAARLRFEAGMEAMGRGDPEAAVVAFEESFATLRYLPTAYNLAVAYEAVGRDREAADLLDRILSGELGEVQDAQRREAESLYEVVRARVGLVEVRASGAGGIWVRVDDEERTRGMAGDAVRVALDPGHHVLQVGAPGQRPRRLAVRAEAGVSNRLTVRFDDRETGSLRLASEVPGAVEIVGFATGPSPLAHDLPAGVYEVGRVGEPDSRRSVRVEPGAVSEVTLGEGGGGDDAVVWGVVLGAIGAVLVAGAVGLGVALADQDEPLTEPVFGIIATLRF